MVDLVMGCDFSEFKVFKMAMKTSEDFKFSIINATDRSYVNDMGGVDLFISTINRMLDNMDSKQIYIYENDTDEGYECEDWNQDLEEYIKEDLYPILFDYIKTLPIDFFEIEDSDDYSYFVVGLPLYNFTVDDFPDDFDIVYGEKEVEVRNILTSMGWIDESDEVVSWTLENPKKH